MEDEWDYISDTNRIAGLRDELKRKSREATELLSERDRLTAENAELREECDAAVEFAHATEHELAAANATLDKLREVVQEVLPPHMSWKDALDGARAILYPKEASE